MENAIEVELIARAFVRGHRTAHRLARYFYPQIPKNSEALIALRKQLSELINTPEFAVLTHKARKGAEDIRDELKSNAAAFVDEMEQIAFGSGDDNVRFQAAKALFVFAGYAPTTKIKFFTPKDYEDKLERDFGEDEEDE